VDEDFGVWWESCNISVLESRASRFRSGAPSCRGSFALTPILQICMVETVNSICTHRFIVYLGDPEITIAPTPVSPGRLARNIVWLDEARPSHVPLKMSLYESL
jgi:hypothetical protein